MHRECREHFPHHRLQRKPQVSDPGMHQGTCVTHVRWCMSGSLTRSCGENAPGIPGARATRNFVYLVRGPYDVTKSWWIKTNNEQQWSVRENVLNCLTHWGRVTHTCVSKLYHGVLPVRQQPNIWTSVGLLSIGPWGKYLNEILFEIHKFSFMKIHGNMTSTKNLVSASMC